MRVSARGGRHITRRLGKVEAFFAIRNAIAPPCQGARVRSKTATALMSARRVLAPVYNEKPGGLG